MPEHLCVSESRSALCGSASAREGLPKSSPKPKGRFFRPTLGTPDFPHRWALRCARLWDRGHGTRREVQRRRLARSARRRTRLRSHSAHPKPAASTPGCLQALLFLWGMSREPSLSDAPSFWPPEVRGDESRVSAKSRTQTACPSARHPSLQRARASGGVPKRAGGTPCRSLRTRAAVGSNNCSVLLISLLSSSECCGRSKPGNERAVSICA